MLCNYMRRRCLQKTILRVCSEWPTRWPYVNLQSSDMFQYIHHLCPNLHIASVHMSMALAYQEEVELCFKNILCISSYKLALESVISRPLGYLLKLEVGLSFYAWSRIGCFPPLMRRNISLTALILASCTSHPCILPINPPQLFF